MIVSVIPESFHYQDLGQEPLSSPLRVVPAIGQLPTADLDWGGGTRERFLKGYKLSVVK